ncbi:Prenylcysteine lyase-domain-containing protein [Emericellopsis atlantica]|uniref:Prenylcysteine lyase-domain-containing protein n=1 Tax=Emericellopsis atlantica TaxID=2614577 RepID=A0A9P7ZFR2_9HYPO|nr:Prenylcysteine lyase-domain-containing protein [Emericellopsis atlantica]KAG9251111.1 Prenylcysteine lyase-domain-containing protein [Emericellopsis atlantica]
MKFPWLELALTGFGATAGEAEVDDNVHNIAIIGAGAAGSSTAYHLSRFAQTLPSNAPALNVTIFEKTDRIGGRSLTAPAPSGQPIELGASIFITKNEILLNATRDFDLALGGLREGSPGDITAIWDGQEFVYQTTDGESWWWDVGKMLWRYGMSPYRAVNLVKDTVGRFLELYKEDNFPFRSLTAKVYELGLVKQTGITGAELLKQNNIDEKFARHIIQAATRVNYASNLAFIHGVEAMVSFATEGAVSVEGGNWQIFDKMVQSSGATLHRNTSVASISRPKQDGKYFVSTKVDGSASTAEAYGIGFDEVVIATPWQFSQITTDASVLRHKIEEVPYTKLHVTLFTSPFRLHPQFFGLAPGAKAPSNVYTTLGEDETPASGADGVGRTGFYSISTLRTTNNPTTGRLEFVYKIFSAEAISPAFLSSVLGTAVPDSFTGDKSPISWYHPVWFHSYPIELPRVTFQDPVVGDGVWYTGGMESFISTMETSALMGMNVAKLIVDEVGSSAQKGGEDKVAKNTYGKGADGPGDEL